MPKLSKMAQSQSSEELFFSLRLNAAGQRRPIHKALADQNSSDISSWSLLGQFCYQPRCRSQSIYDGC